MAFSLDFFGYKVVLDSATARIAELEEAIKKHRAQTGNNLCWENDLELWAILKDEDPQYPHKTLPNKEEFLRNCKAYYESRLINIKIPNENKT